MAYEEDHAIALEFFDVSPFSVYHEDIISMHPENWNNSWFNFWKTEK